MSTATLTASEPSRFVIQALLDRLDPTRGVCTVQGCEHLHEHQPPKEYPPLAAA